MSEKIEGKMPQHEQLEEELESETGFDFQFPIRVKNKEGKLDTFDALNLQEVSNEEFIRWAESRGLQNVPWEKIDLNNPRKRLLTIELFLSK